MDSISRPACFHRRPPTGRVVVGLLFAGVVGAVANQVTYQVNMGVQRQLGTFRPASGDTVLVSGDFSEPDWGTTFVLTPSASDSNLYTGTFDNDVAAGDTGHHKFIINPGGAGSSGQLLWESPNNRWFQVEPGNQILDVVHFDDITNSTMTPPASAIEFLAGADMSHVGFFEDRGITYRADGQAQDVFDILKERGLNCIRLRLFTSSASQASADPYNYINNLDYTLPLAVRVKAAGLKLLLDFHYSDTWADPGDQLKPDAWSGLNFSQLEQQIQDYSSNSIAALKTAGAMPDYVQVGNEIIGGMLWDDGRVGGAFNNATQWNQLGALMKAAISGIQGAAGTTAPQIIVHIDRGGDWVSTRGFFEKLNQEGVPYDIIGQSFYPWWHGRFIDLQFCLANTIAFFGKPVVVMETAFPWTNSTYNPNLGIPKTVEGQVQYTVRLAEVVKGLPNRLGDGIFWWGSEYVHLGGQPLAGFDRASFFDFDGSVLPVVQTLGQLTSDVALSATRKENSLSLQWPLSGAGLSLTTTTSPAPTAIWMNVTNPVTNLGGPYRATVPMGETPRQFYRLESTSTP